MKLHSYRYIAIIIVLLLVNCARAQEGGGLQGFGVETNILGGRIVKHKIVAPIPAISTAVDVNFVWQTYGKAEWHQRRNFPAIGMGITYTNYGNNRVFGQCVGIYPNLQIPLITAGRLQWTFRLGDGLGYVTRKYQTTAPEDTLNTAIGSHLNDFAIFMTDIRIHIDRHWHLQFGANFTHISNADFHQPNLGVNVAGAHIGILYYPETCRPKKIIRDLPRLRNRWLAEIRLSTAFTEARTPGSPELPTYVAAAYASRRWLGKNKLYMGADYAFHEDTYEELKYWSRFEGQQAAHAWDGAVFVGNEFLVGRLGLITQAGVYYHQTYLKFDPVYEKIGGNFYIIKNEHGPIKELFVSALLLTHAIVAEFAEFGIGAGI
jgi:hypothetical protein